MSVQSEKIALQNGQGRLEQNQLRTSYPKIRRFTEFLTDPLEIEDFVIQVDVHVSPTKWHLAHTSWFFETFLLNKALPDYQTQFPQYDYLFNSYYLQTGEPHCRDKRGSLSRPTVQEVFTYRRYIDEQVESFMEATDEDEFAKWADVIEIGLHHEQQHQELLVTDLKYMFGQNPLYPAYRDVTPPGIQEVPSAGWLSFEEGVCETGHNGEGFGFDNEFPEHKSYLHKFELADRLVTNDEYIHFIEDGGYGDSRWWLDKGYETVRSEEWTAPLYWARLDGEWHYYTLGGFKKIDRQEPVCHVSYYEADAFARWSGCRLPGEEEWEVAAGRADIKGNFVESGFYHPAGTDTGRKAGLPRQLFGDVWEWTQSAYSPYPGYEPLPGALGEYNGKFMCGQYVLKGGSCATPESHIRKTYRNFFYPGDRWQFSGIRLAR